MSICITAAQANTHYKLSEADFIGEMPVVLTSSRLSQPLSHAPTAITVIDREMIEASGALEVVHLLRLVPGFQVAEPNGSSRTAAYHGFADQHPRRMQVMVDGRSVYNSTWGGVLWESMPLAVEDVDRIEVTRGPNAAAYGSNAFLGSINIITRRPDTADGTQVSVTGGSQDTAIVNASHSAQLGDNTRIRASVGYKESSGLDSIDDDYDQLRFNLRGETQITAQDLLEYQVSYQDATSDDGFEGDIVQPPRSRNVEFHQESLTWTRQLGDSEELRVQAYHNFTGYDDLRLVPEFVLGDFNFPEGTFSTDISFREHRYDIELQHSFALSQKTRMVWGAGFRKDTTDSPFFIAPTDLERDSQRLFLNAEHQLSPSLILNGGLMLEHFENIGSYASPRFSINHLFGNGHTLRVAAGRAYRMPALFEQYEAYTLQMLGEPIEALGIGDRNIDPEEIRSYEIGYIGILPGRPVTLEARLFRYDISDVIFGAIAENPEPYFDIEELETREYQTNLGDMRIDGFELAVKYRPTARTFFHLAYSNANGRGSEVRDLDANYVPVQWDPDVHKKRGKLRKTDDTVPQQTLTLLASHSFDNGLQLSGQYNYIDKNNWRGEGEKLDRINRVDARLTKTFRSNASDIQISLIAHNLLNDKYFEFRDEDPLDRPMNIFDRRIYGQVAIQFK